jgi:glycosyltransferase involved in cell wall biosynthesis
MGMRILYVSSKKGWGGVAGWMQKTALGLEARGHKVWIISHPKSRFTSSASRGIRIIPKRLGMDYNPLMIFYVVRFIRRNLVDIVVTNIQKEITIGGSAAKVSGVASIRRIGSSNDINDRFRWRQRHLVDHTIVPSFSVLDEAKKKVNWLDPARYTVIYNGRNPRAYSAAEIADRRRRWGLSEKDFIIGSTAQLSKVKGIDRLIRVFKSLVASQVDARLVITGEGPELGALEAEAARLGIADRVVFAGFSDNPAEAAAAYDVAVLNSTEEGFPNAVVEYLAAGTAVVSTDVGGVREIVDHGRNGLLVWAGDDARLLEALSSLARDPGLRLRLAAEGFKTIEKGFSEDVMVDRLEAFFKERLERKRG